MKDLTDQYEKTNVLIEHLQVKGTHNSPKKNTKH